MSTAAPTTPDLTHGSLLALAKPNQSVLTVVIVAAVAVLLLVLLLRHLIRKRGGRRRFRRRLGRELTLTRRAFGEPLRAYRRHRRGVRALGRQLSDPRKGLLVRRLLDAAAAALADAPGAFPYAVRTAPGHAAVQIAARGLPTPPAPWEAPDDLAPQRWELSLSEEDALPETGSRPSGRSRPLPVAVGMADGACVHLDLAAGPRLITVEGDLAARTRLLQALAAQLDRPGSGASVTVAEGVHPHYRGERLDAVLRELEEARMNEAPGNAGEFEESGGAGRAATTVVVCAAPSPTQARRLGALAASGAVVCLAEGRTAGHSWVLRVDPRGRVVASALALEVDAAPLSRAVAATIRADRRRQRREATRRRSSPAPRRSKGRGRRTQELEGTRRLQETESREEGAAPQETPPPRETTSRTTTPPRTTTGSGLLAEPAAARERATAASSGSQEE